MWRRMLIIIPILIIAVFTPIHDGLLWADADRPRPDIKINGSDGPLTLFQEDPVKITVSLACGGAADQEFDWWLIAETPFGLYSYQLPAAWASGISVCLQEPLINFSDYSVYESTLPAEGEYVFYFGVDDRVNGSLDDPVFDSVALLCEGTHPPSNPCPDPPGITATDGTHADKIVVNWKASEFATSYDLYRADSSKGEKELITSTASLSYSDYSAACNTDYYYWVQAKNATGGSGFFYYDIGYRQCAAPKAPSNLRASDGSHRDRIRITWDPSSNASTYDLYRAESENGEKTKIQSTADNSFDDTAVSCDLAYYYWVKAKSGDMAESGFSNCDPGYKACSAGSPSYALNVNMPAPTGVTATDGQYAGKIVVRWDSVPGAASYNVFRAKENCGVKTKIGSTGNTTYEDTTVPDQSTYYYWVKATNCVEYSEFSIKHDTGYLMNRPSAPAWVSASDGKYMNKIHIKWKSVANAASYNIYRVNFGKFNLSFWLNKEKIRTTSKTSFYDASVPSSTSRSERYYYWVEASNAAGTSDVNVGDSGYAYRTLKDPNVYATDGSLSCCVRIEWNAVNGAKRYDIYRATFAEGRKTKIASVGGDRNTFEDASVTCPVKYFYWVKAVDRRGFTSSEYGGYDSGFCRGQ